MDRRNFLASAALGAGAVCLASEPPGWNGLVRERSQRDPVHSVIPVVGDGKWIWTRPPENQTGYLEDRPFDLSIGVELQGDGNAQQIKASTPVPVEHPEQKIDQLRIETDGCEARIQQIGEGAAQLLVAAPRIVRGQKIRALAHYRLTLKKQYFGYEREQFPAEQAPPADVRKLYLQDSPGIQTHSPEVKKLLAELQAARGQAAAQRGGSPQQGLQQPDASQAGQEHPWDFAQRCFVWVRENIRPQIGDYIGVINALKQRVGDCEEMAGIFVALCRAAAIPARLVWVPNHNWAEFYLTDNDGKGHWIPAHTACYHWFGWTGAHELVIQKGDRVTPVHERRPQRLLEDWLQWSGKRPNSHFVAELKPLPAEDATGSAALADAGPGARSKLDTGEWKLVGTHPLDKFMRQA